LKLHNVGIMKTLKFKILSIFFDEFQVLTIDAECSIKVIAYSCKQYTFSKNGELKNESIGI